MGGRDDTDKLPGLTGHAPAVSAAMGDTDPRAGLRWRRGWEAIGVLGVATVIVLSLVPLPQTPGYPGFADKLEHAGVYGLLMLWFGCIYGAWGRRVALGLGLVAIGATLELAQGLLAYRSFELADLAANATGVAGGLALAATRAAGALGWLETRLGIGPQR